MKGQLTISAGWTATRKQSTNRLVLNSPSWTPETWSPWDKSNNEEGEIKEERIAKGLSRREVAHGAQFTGAHRTAFVGWRIRKEENSGRTSDWPQAFVHSLSFTGGGSGD